MWGARCALPLFIYPLYSICESIVDRNWWMQWKVGPDFIHLFQLPRRRFKVVVVVVVGAKSPSLWTKSWWIPHCWSFDTVCFHTVFSQWALIRDRNPWWLLISYLVVMYIGRARVKPVVTLLLHLLYNVLSSLKQTFGKKYILNVCYPLLPLFFFLHHREILLFDLKRPYFKDYIKRVLPCLQSLVNMCCNETNMCTV